jgi:predicted XRE-type DNA-binding protein
MTFSNNLDSTGNQAANLALRSDMMEILIAQIENRRFTQAKAAKV